MAQPPARPDRLIEREREKERKRERERYYQYILFQWHSRLRAQTAS